MTRVWTDDIAGFKDIIDATGDEELPLPRRPTLKISGSAVVTDRPADNLTEIEIDVDLSDLTADVAAAQADATQALADASTAQAAADATEFRLNTQSGTTYTLDATDFDGRTEIQCTHASGCAITVPSGLSVTAWRPLVIVQAGAGQVTLVESSTTIRRTDTLKTRKQWSPIVLVSTSVANTYQLRGDTESS